MSFLYIWYYFATFSPKLRYILVVFCALILLESTLVSADDGSAAASRERAVQLAREGDLKKALKILEPLYLKTPDNTVLLYDYITVLSWAEHDREVRDLLNKIDTEKAPLFVISAAAKSLRRIGEWETAERMYRLGIRRFPDDIDIQAGLILTVTDAGYPDEALKIADKFIENNQWKKEIRLAQAYAAEAADKVYRALMAYQKVLSRDSLNQKARHRQIMLLHRLGAYARSLELAEQYPEAIEPGEYRKLRGDKTALDVRWSKLSPVSEETRFNECERAIEQLEKILNSTECQDSKEKVCRQARMDRLSALSNCSRSEEVIEEYQSLRAEGERLPDYILEVAAWAMLNIREREQALDLYQEIVQRNPKAYQARVGLFFALIENERFSEAQELIDNLVSEEPVWIYPGGMKTPRANWQGQTTKIYEGLNLFFADKLDEAERHFTAMTEKAPSNTDLLREMGSVYLARGWTRRALEVIELGQALEPKHRGLRIGHAEADMALREYDKAEEEISNLLIKYPEDQQVQRLNTKWQLYNMRELRLDTTLSNSSGSVYGDREWEISTTVFSRPLHNQYRWFAGLTHVQADFPEGSGDLMRYSAGIEYSSPGLEAALSTGFNDSESNRAGLWLEGKWHLDDYWSIPLNAEIYSRNTPLRAIRNGVHANALSLGVSYRAHESRSINLMGQIMDFSDSNFRTRFVLSGNQRLLTFPKHKLTASGELSVSKNSRERVPYFNPDSDLSLTCGLEYLWRIYRRYEKSFHQRVSVSAGYYSQHGFGGDYTTGFEYAYIMGLGHRYNMSYGVGIKRRVYDGEPEWSNYVFLSLNWRF